MAEVSANGLVQVSEAARLLGMSKRTLSAYLSRGVLPTRARHGRARLVDVGELRALLEDRREAVEGDPPRELIDDALRRIVRCIVREELEAKASAIAEAAREAGREEGAEMLRDLPEQLIKVVGQSARRSELAAKRARAEADRLASARRALEDHRAEMSAVAARTAAARARGV